jgi:hypothetical protein
LGRHCRQQRPSLTPAAAAAAAVSTGFSSLLQQDIARGRGMVDELFQGWGGTAGTQNAVLSSSDYLSQAAKTFNNIEDGEQLQLMLFVYNTVSGGLLG